MSTYEYVPSESDFRDAYRAGRDVLALDFGEGGEGQADAEFDRFLARVRRDAQRESAQMIRDACDRWEVDGDDERLVNDVLDPWTSRVLSPEESP